MFVKRGKCLVDDNFFFPAVEVSKILATSNEMIFQVETERLVRGGVSHSSICVGLHTESTSQINCASVDKYVDYSNSSSLYCDVKDSGNQKMLENRKKWKCEFSGCWLRFSKKTHLIRHQRSHTRERPFKCTYCSKDYSRNDHLKAHILATHECDDDNGENVKHSCHICSKQFKRPQHLKRHMKTHMKLFKCTVCSEAFARKRQLRRHELIHVLHAKKSYFGNKKAPHDNRCDTEKNISRSEASEHKDYIQPNDELCSSGMATDTDKISCNMWDKDVNLALQEFKCPDEGCGAAFKTVECLFRHMNRTITRERDYECQPCSLMFHRFSDLVAHRRNNHASKVHICNICSKAYTRNSALQHHMKIKHCDIIKDDDDICVLKNGLVINNHTAGFNCSVCGVLFSSKSNLNVHMRVKHLNERRFSCPKCDKKFGYKIVLKQHLAVKHGSDILEKTNDVSKTGNISSILKFSEHISKPSTHSLDISNKSESCRYILCDTLSGKSGYSDKEKNICSLESSKNISEYADSESTPHGGIQEANAENLMKNPNQFFDAISINLLV